MRNDALPDVSQIYRDYHGKVLAYATKLLGREEADDVSQEVFIKIGRSLGTLSDPAKLSSWIYAVTLNTIRDAARKRSSRPDRLFATFDGGSGEEAGGAAVADAAARTPEEIAMRHEMTACYLDYVKRLPREYYEVYALSEFDHLSNEDIARRLSLTLGAVKIRLHRARARLYQELRRNCRCYTNERGELMGEPRTRARRPDFSGDWAFNREESRLGLDSLGRLERAVMHVSHREPRFGLRRSFRIDGREHEVSFELTTDGEELVRRDGERELASRLGWEGDALRFATRILSPEGEGENIVRYRMRPDGKLEADESYRGPGLEYDNLWVFDRV